jgi:hypothetical protein
MGTETVTDATLLERAGRIGAQLARLPRGQDFTPDKVGKDAAALLCHAIHARDAIEGQDRAGYRRSADAIKPVAATYGATVIRNSDPAGMVIGLQLPEGHFTSGHKNWFFLA